MVSHRAKEKSYDDAPLQGPGLAEPIGSEEDRDSLCPDDSHLSYDPDIIEIASASGLFSNLPSLMKYKSRRASRISSISLSLN